MGSLTSSIFNAAWVLTKIFVGSIIWAISMPFTIMMLDDGAISLQEWFSD